jgi:lipoprotein-anchoring transpeptidase ErfK/SrfK
MARTSVGFRVVTVVVAIALTVFSVGFTWAVVDDYSQRQVVPKGATVEGVPVGGLPREQAIQVVQDKVEKLLLAPLTVSFKGKTFTLDPAQYMSVDVAGMVDGTFQPQTSATLANRVVRRLTGESVTIDVPRKLKVDSTALAAWIADTAKHVDSAAVDSSVTVASKRLHFSKAYAGYRLDQQATLALLSKALRDGKRDVAMKIDTVKPRITEASFGKSILVVKSERHLYLYNGPKIVKDYPCAIGMPGHPTPAGWWVIENKRYMPAWTNPGSGWANGMPSYIAPGYSNPLGTRALDLNASGIRIHGSSNDYSIGSAASHGCMRMHMWDIEDLYDRVDVGTRVVIIP